ncbi:MAG TPA: sulfatase-like hydrolase/transferase, partial [Chitinophagaceae bacterium]|nr:sulfatase-like hydrolase/transferase [Chitinophagaceae bacterium]
WLRRANREFGRTFAFLNLLFLLLAVLEVINLLPRVTKNDPYHPPPLAAQFMNCDSCSRPDIYVIIADEYAGQKELREVFSFDNSEFENELQSRGFHIVSNTNSNYNATVYSMASLFNMGYIDLTGNGLVSQQDMLLCRSIISNSNTGYFFKERGYEMHNFSFFEVEGRPKAVNNYYFPPKRKLFLSQTFISRFRKEVSYNFFSKKKKEAVENNDHTNDETVDKLTKALAARKTTKPKFVYTHFTRPHHPYYVDRNGHPFPKTDSLKGFDLTKKLYTEQLLYTNKRLIELIDVIKKTSATPPIILLASDHGFRQFTGQGDKPYYFMNFCAVFFPNGQYANFYEGMSPVNTFRVILNTTFGQQLPLLKDSSVFLVEKN